MLVLGTSPARGQPVDAGVPDDAALPGDAGTGLDAAPSEAPPAPSLETHRATVLERELEAQAREATREQAEATNAAARAAEQGQSAATGAQLLLAEQRAALEAARAGQARFRRGILAARAALVTARVNHASLLEELDAALAGPGPLDVSYDRAVEALEALLADALSSARDLPGGPPRPPAAPTLDPALVELPAEHAAERHTLYQLHELARTRATELAAEARLLQLDRIDFHKEALDDLAARKVALLGRLSEDKRSDLRFPDARTLAEVRDEGLQIALEVGYWAHLRYRQLGRWITEEATWLSVGDVLWSVTELMLLLAALAFALRRWDSWMTRIIAAAGRSLHLGTWPLFVARVAELARTFGPPLVVMVAALLAYLHVGGRGAVPEARVAFIVVFWMASLRAQLRFVESLSQLVGTRNAERARSQQELEAHDLTDPDAAPRKPPRTERAGYDDLEPTWMTLSRTWRLGTRYLGVVIILLELIDLAVGRGITYGLIRRAAWWGSIPIVIQLLRMWRPRIVHAYLARSRDPGGVLARLADRHGGRFYGVPFVAAAFVVVLVQQTIAFVRRHLSNLDSTKRLLAWLFRRRVEKHAQEHGRVLEQPHELPIELVDQFPRGSLAPTDHPRRHPCLDELKAQFAAWKERGSGGSVALVGASGMGKSTVLELLDAELGEPVRHAALVTKVTDTAELLRELSRLLDLGATPSSEQELVALIRTQECRVLAVDDCHNLFLRQVGGFWAWESFTRIVNETSDKVFWVVTFNDIAWEYLNNIAARMSYFRKIIHLPAWSDQEIRQLILSRTRRARYRLNFTDLLVSRIEGASISSQIIGTSQGYFRLLWDFTNGNPRDACHFWLRSLVPDPEQRRARVHLFAAPRLEELQRLPDDIVFVLQAVAEHENLNADELRQATNMAPEFCRFALRYCREAGYLWRDPSTGRTELSVHWHQTIILYLKRQHLIYS